MHDWRLLLLGTVLVTWTSALPEYLVTIERRLATEPVSAYALKAVVQGTGYTDRWIAPQTRYCYRLRWDQGTTWTPEHCVTTKPAPATRSRR